MKVGRNRRKIKCSRNDEKGGGRVFNKQKKKNESKKKKIQNEKKNNRSKQKEKERKLKKVHKYVQSISC